MVVSAWLIFFIGVIVGAILGSIGICVVALAYKGDKKDGGKNKENV